MITQLVDPPQGDEYMPLPGDLFPKTYPLEDSNERTKGSFFWRKYYITQRLFFSFAKRPQYCNFEILTNAFKQNIIDLSQAEIVMLKTSESSPQQFESFIS